MKHSIDLWFSVPSEAVCDDLLRAYRALLSDDEIAKGERFIFPEQRRDYLITRALVRTVLSDLVGMPAKALRFGANPLGRPFLLGYGELQFNISHTAGLIALAVAHGGNAGIDVEQLGTNRSTLELAEYSLAANEVAALRVADPSDFDQTFFSFWTLKESYVKELGTGLTTPLDSFQFNLTNTRLIEFTPPPNEVDSHSLYFWLFQPKLSHICALCARFATHVPSFNFQDDNSPVVELQS